MQNSRPLRCSQPDEVRCFIHGGYCRICAGFNEESFAANWHPPTFVLQSLLGKYIKNLYQTFDRDLVMALVMCEIWEYNLGRYFDRYGPEDATTKLNNPEARRALLPPCNTYSISQVLGVPNETVRRKVKKLVKLGWVQNGTGELVATQAGEAYLCPDSNIEMMRESVSAVRHLLTMLE